LLLYAADSADSKADAVMSMVIGVDGAKDGWAAIGLRDGKLDSASYHATLAALVGAHPDAAVIAIDLPIGLADGPREADLAARRLLGPRRSSLFPMPPRTTAHLPYEEARVLWRGSDGSGFSKQTWAVVSKVLAEENLIRETDRFGDRIIEVHPELSFMEMAQGRPMAYSKRTWNGHQERLRSLEAVGFSVASDLGDLGKASPDDVLDAFAAAWTAARFQRRQARCVPEAPIQSDGERLIRIWR